ncbi:hypothetical protein DL771_006710 [Monosporascus sp. 5C6A]|nr:hypothetical protein DL771_006710 [Monosporascus sp. 5C6A]
MADIPERPDYEPIDAVPIVAPQMRLLLRGLNKGSVLDVALTVRKITKVNRDVGCMKHVAKDENTWLEANFLLHSIPKLVIILRTVATQSRLQPGDPRYLASDIYHRDGPGTCVAIIAIPRRNGMWLTGKELQRLVDLVKRYWTPRGPAKG